VSNTTPTRKRPLQAYIMKVSWPIEGILIASTKNLSIFFYFYLFCPNSLFQTTIPFSLHPDGDLRRSSWPCRPRTTLRRASPNGILPGEAIQGDRCEFTHHLEAGSQTATQRSQTASSYSPIVIPLAQPIRLPASLTEP
jgi:hypothetical protein